MVSAGAPQTCCHGWTLTTVLSSCSEARRLVLWSTLTTEWAPWDRSPGPRTPVTPSVYHAIEHLPPGRRKSHVDAQTNEWVQHPALSTVRVNAHLWTHSGTGRACEHSFLWQGQQFPGYTLLCLISLHQLPAKFP